MQSNPEPNTGIAPLIDANPEWFETLVLAASCRSRDFYNKFHGAICVGVGVGDEQNDFSYPSDNLIYKMTRTYRDLTAGQSAVEVVPPVYYQATMMAFVASGDAQPEQVEPVMQRVQSIMTCPLDNMIPVISQGVGFWLSKVRLRKVVARQMADPNWKPTDLLREMTQAESAGRMADAPVYTHKFGDGRKAKKLHVERIPSGIHKLDKAMGGGFGYQEMTLIIGSTGAGKTVLASQLAGGFAINGFPGIWISTEETHEALEPRIYSNFCNIPYNDIKDGVDVEKLAKDKAEAVHELERRIGDNMLILDWVNDRSKTIVTDLAEEIRKFEDQYKRKPAWLMFDWLGGAQGNLTTKEMQVIRHLLQQTADHLADMAKLHSMVVIALAQGNITQCRNNMKVDSACMQENKSLGRKATTIIGISQLQEQPDGLMNGEPPYQKKQFLYISKSRRGIGGLVPVIRAFEFQRYDNIDKADTKPKGVQ